MRISEWISYVCSSDLGLSGVRQPPAPGRAEVSVSRLRAFGIGILHLWPIALVLLAWDLWVVLNGYTATVAPRPWSVLGDILTHFDAYAPSTGYTLLM